MEKFENFNDFHMIIESACLLKLEKTKDNNKFGRSSNRGREVEVLGVLNKIC